METVLCLQYILRSTYYTFWTSVFADVRVQLLMLAAMLLSTAGFTKRNSLHETWNNSPSAILVSKSERKSDNLPPKPEAYTESLVHFKNNLPLIEVKRRHDAGCSKHWIIVHYDTVQQLSRKVACIDHARLPYLVILSIHQWVTHFVVIVKAVSYTHLTLPTIYSV